MGGGQPQNFWRLSFADIGYQMLPLATSHWVGDNREFNVLGTF